MNSQGMVPHKEIYFTKAGKHNTNTTPLGLEAGIPSKATVQTTILNQDNMLVHWPLGVSSKPKPQQRYYFVSIKSIEKICENDRVRLEPGPRETQAISLTQNAPSLTVYRDGPTRAL